MSTFVRAALAHDTTVEEQTFGPLEQLTISQEGQCLVNATELAIDRYDAIVESAQSLEALTALAQENPQSLESLSVPFQVVSSGYLKGDLSLEGIGSFLKKVWEAIVKAWTKVKEMVMKLINWITGRGGKSQKQSVKNAQRTFDRDDKIVAEVNPKKVQSSADEFTRALAKREKELTTAAKKVEHGLHIDAVLDAIPTDNFEDFEKFMSGDADSKPTEMSAKDYAKDLESSIDATESTAKQYEKTIKARDDLQKVIDKNVSKTDVDDDGAMAAAFRKLQEAAEVKAGKVLNAAAKQNAKGAAKVERMANAIAERKELEAAKVAQAFVTRNSDIVASLKRSNKVEDPEEGRTITVDRVIFIRTKSPSGKIVEYIAPFPEKGYRGGIRPFDVGYNNEAFIRGSEISGIPHINTEDQPVITALLEIPNYIKNVDVSKLTI